MLNEVENMKKNKRILAGLLSCLLVFVLGCCTVAAAPANKDAKYSVDATEIEYDMGSGDGTTTGKTTIKHDGGVAVAQGGSTFNSKTRTGHLFGGVTAKKEDSHLSSQELFMYTDKFVSAVGNAILTKGDKTLKAHRVDYHDDKEFAETLGGYAHLSATDGSWLTAGKIVYDMKTGVANATGGVKMEITVQKMTGSGDRAIYDSHETGYIELIGNATATQDGNTVTGDKLRITNVSGPDSKTHAQGNVRIVYYQKPDKEVSNPAFGEGAVLMANGATNFNPAPNMMEQITNSKSDTEARTV